MPTVSAVIATYNRAADLAVSLPKLYDQTRPPDELVIVDDGSTDNTATLINERFPQATYLRLPTNQGLIAARNHGIRKAKGDYILSLDDDCWFLNEAALASALNQTAAAAILTFNLLLPNGTRTYPENAPPFHSPTFLGGASLLHRASVIAAGLYPESFRCFGEESDLALRLYDAGHSILTLPAITVYHAQSPANRSEHRTRFYTHRNAVLTDLLRCPTPYLPLALPRTWAANTLYNLKQGYWTTDLELSLTLPGLLKIAATHRHPVTRQTYRNWRRLRASSF
ncbi:MAG: glycosyltransferase family 2 protein [Acidobacteriota bacterium]